MAVDMIIKMDGIKGESQLKDFKDDIDVLAWSWGGSQSASSHYGGGGGSGKADVLDLSITKWVDKSSPVLFYKMLSAEHIKTVSLHVRKAGGDKVVEYLKIDLENVIVSSVNTGGNGGEDRLSENVTLNFKTVKVTYTPQNSDGGADAAIDMGWDIASNERL